MSEIVVFVAVYAVFGVLVAGLHAFNWGHRPRFRHLLVWPLVNGFMLSGQSMPEWLR